MNSEVTIKHIAAALDISAMTVSRALNNRSNVNKKTRDQVIEKAKSMGYTPNHVAKSLVSNKTFTIGVVIPEISHAFFPEVVRGIEEITNASDYQLFLTNTNEQFNREKEVIQTLRSKRVDGLLISSSQRVDDYSFYEEFIDSGVNLVFFDRCIKNIGASCVSVNDKASSEKITNHLIESYGYTQIAHLSGPRNISTGMERLEGYLKALRTHDIMIQEKWIIEGGFNEESGYEAMKKILSLPKKEYPEAVVAVNDPMAFGAIKAIREKSLSIPDDIREPLLETPLTTVHQPAYEVGRRAAQKLIRTIDNPDEPAENIEVLTTLKIRKSCGNI